MADGIGGIIAGANPYGGIAEAAGGIVQAITTAVTAAQQRKRAQELRDQANQVQPEAIRPEFLTAERNAQMQSLYGLPALNAYQTQIGKNIASSVRAIHQSSPNGGATLAAIDNALASGNNSETDLAAKDAQAQENKAQNANQQIDFVGEQQRKLQDIQDKQKQALQAQAGNLETASTINKQQGINEGIGGVEQGASQMFKKDNSPDLTTRDTTPITPLNANPYAVNTTNPYKDAVSTTTTPTLYTQLPANQPSMVTPQYIGRGGIRDNAPINSYNPYAAYSY